MKRLVLAAVLAMLPVLGTAAPKPSNEGTIKVAFAISEHVNVMALAIPVTRQDWVDEIGENTKVVLHMTFFDLRGARRPVPLKQDRTARLRRRLPLF